jgi:capsular polysaccharide biosynthesis protein
LYDTLPYLITYFELKKKHSDLKLLMNFPNPQKNSHYPFVLEFLEILGISESDIVIIEKGVLYNKLFISTSYTHDGMSNKPPRKEIYGFYQNIVNRVLDGDSTPNLPKKIYISRRSWLHNDFSNIGTNYTTRRKLLNEDELVSYLVDLGFTEIFTEKLSTVDKIKLFSNCECVVGSIGGGLANVLFSKPKTRLISIISPGFLEINERFKYSFEKVSANYFEDTYHSEKDRFKRFMRIKSGNIIGEVSDVMDDTLIVDYVDENISGWN